MVRSLASIAAVSVSLLLTAPLHAQDAAPAAVVAAGGTIHGRVTASTGTAKTPSATPLPGVAITALNSLTGRKYTTATDVDGNFALAIPTNGRYVVRAELAAFANGAKEILLNATSHDGSADFTLELASRAAAKAETSTSTAAVTSALRGLQSLGVTTGTDSSTQDASANATSAPSVPSLGGLENSSTDSVAISGRTGETNGLAGISEDDLRERINDAMQRVRQGGGNQSDQMGEVVSMLGGIMQGMGGGPGGGPGGGGPGGGGPGGGGRGGGFGGGGRGGFGNFSPTQIHGAAYYQTGNAVLDATPFSLVGQPFKPSYSTNRYGLSFTGSPYIPGLFKPNLTQFVFLNFTGNRDTTPQNLYSTVPTADQRLGHFAGLTQVTNGAAQAVTLYQPGTSTPYANNDISSQINPAAQALLNNYFPLPNLTTPTQQGYNYQRIVNAASNGAQLSARYIKNFGANASQMGGGFFQRRQQQNAKPTLRQNMNVAFNYGHTAADTRGRFVVSDSKSASDNYGLNAGYVIGYGRLNNNFTVSWNRSHSLTTNIFTYGSTDPSNGLNIPRPGSVADCFYCGLPSITLTNFSSLSQTTPSDRINQTISLSEGISWIHRPHNFRFGFDLRRLHQDVIGGNNALGSLTFSGYATQGTVTSGTGGSIAGAAIADFLLGDPQQSKIQAGLNKTYLREWVIDGYAQDDWRLHPNLTLNLGLRWEYFGPYTEKYDRLVNLDHSADFTTVAAVQPNQVGPYSGRFPRSLVNADRTMFSPRFGFAWNIKQLKGTVLRGGYGLNFNTSQYGNFANSLSYQPPFAITQTNTATQDGCGNFSSGFHLTSAFGCTTTALQNNFSINRDYRLARVHVVNLDVQKTWPFGIVTNLGYNGSFSGSLDVRRAPGHTATGNTTNAASFVYEDSIGASRFSALSFSARKRMSRGVSMQATYQYGHSIDNAYSVNGSGTNLIAQNDQRLDLEYGNSSFDLRHQVSGEFIYELPFGPNRAFLTKGGFWAGALDGWNFSSNYKFATGTYSTPQYTSTVAQIATGGNYTLRPDRVFSQSINGGAGTGTLGHWFNTSAFIKPQGADGFGTASRNSIQNPGTVSVNASLARNQRFGTGSKSLEFRATGSNIFNTVQYSGVNTTLNSASFGQITSVAAPRKFTFMARYRF